MSGRIARRGAVVGVLALLERLAVPATSLALLERSFAAKAAFVAALGAVFTVRGFAQRAFASRTEADLTQRVIASLLDGDLLRASVLPDEDARTELAQGLYHAGMQLAQELPVLIADLVASLLLGLFIVAAEPGRLVLVTVALTIVAALTLGWSRSRVQRAVNTAWKLQQKVLEHLVDALEGRAELVALGLRDPFLAESNRRTRAWGTGSVRIAAATMLSGRLPLLAIAGLVSIAVAVESRWRGALAVPLADLALFASVSPAFAGVAQGMHAIARGNRWVAVVARVVETARPAPEHGRRRPATPASIAFENVSFRYPEAEEYALRDLSFSWDGSGILALAGANGSGKSTCLRLILMLARAEAGVVRIGGVDPSEADADGWRVQVAFLPQRPYLPQRSDVRSALRLLAPDASDAKMIAALDRVRVLPALRRVSADPLDVRVDALSVGQRQRLALARILCRDAALFVLDEPDANLDRDGIALVADILRERARTSGVVFVAHTPELLAIADRTVSLSAGQLSEGQ
jgi:ABC-type transport system involved in cytochrome bd biosynthesis fused ATPase/permease subunit